MPVPQRKDFNELLKKSQELISSGKAKSITDLSRILRVQRSSLMSLFERNFSITSYDDIMKARPKVQNDKDETPLIGTEHADAAEIEIDGNEAVIRSVVVVDQIKTIDQLMKLTGAEKDFVIGPKPKVKKWDVAIKVKEGKDVEVIKVVPSIYIEAPLIRKVPIAFEPVVRPIALPANVKPYKSGSVNSKGIRRALIVNDPQVGFRRRLHTSELTPFHDRRVLDLALQIAESEQIDHISFGGDCLDLSEWSDKYMPEPEFYWTTQPALIEWAWWLHQFRKAKPKAEIKEMEGNHDERMPRLIVAGMRQAYRLKPVDELTLPPSLSVPRLLALHDLGVEYVGGYPDNGYWLNKNIYITHGDIVRGAPGGTANAFTQRQAFTTVFGHVHRREHVARRLATQQGDLVYSAFCPGCACHIDGRVPGSTSKSQWQQGIAIVEYSDTDENIIPIGISDGRMMYNSKLWEARKRDDEINDMLAKSLEQATQKED